MLGSAANTPHPPHTHLSIVLIRLLAAALGAFGTLVIVVVVIIIVITIRIHHQRSKAAAIGSCDRFLASAEILA
jgi:hypothetical protein